MDAPIKPFDPYSTNIRCGDTTTFKYKHYEFEYDRKTDQITLMDTKAVESVDQDEIRSTNTYKTIHVYDDRYSGEVFKIEIKTYRKWVDNFDNEPIFVYMLISHFDMSEQDATNFYQVMSMCLPSVYRTPSN